MRINFKYIVYLVVLIACSVCRSGSFDDFFIAIKNDRGDEVTSLLKRGFDVNTRDASGQPGLTVAMRERSLKAAKALLAVPALDVNALNAARESALMLAALKGEVTGARMLLDRGAQIQLPGWSPIHYAATGPEVKLVELFLDRGADVNALAPNGSTPLMMAAQYGTEEGVKVLLDRGADGSRRNQLDLRAADFARMAGRDSLARKLEGAGR